MAAAIYPSNGRQVHYHRGAHDRIPQHDPGQPLAAMIVHVWNKELVSLVVCDSEGVGHFRREVRLLDAGDTPPENGRPWATWPREEE